jgi:hypothetical protein
MEESTIARVMASTLIWSKDELQPSPELLAQLQKINDAVQYLVENYEALIEKVLLATRSRGLYQSAMYNDMTLEITHSRLTHQCACTT